MTININSQAVVHFTNQLEKISRSAMPYSVRETLNKAAFNVKQDSMPRSADKHFQKRSPNFFKANSKVVKATGFKLENMKATVGFISHKLKYNNEAVRDLEDQEYGGNIDKRSFIPMDTARSGGNATRVRPSVRFDPIKSRMKISSLQQLPKTSGVVATSRKAQFAKTALYVGLYGFFISKSVTGKSFLRRVERIDRVGNKTKIKTTPLYSYRPGRDVNISDDTHFMREASLRTAKKLNVFYENEFKRQLNRIK